MSVDTRTPRTPTGGGAPGFDERVLTMPRVPSDPAQVIVNHVSFRVQLGANSSRALGLDDTAKIPVVTQAAGAGRRRAAPVVWSGQGASGDPVAGQLMQAVRRADAATNAATQVLPRIDDTTVLPQAAPAAPTVVGPRTAEAPTGLLPRPYGPADADEGAASGGSGDAAGAAPYSGGGRADGRGGLGAAGHADGPLVGWTGGEGPQAGDDTAAAERRPRNRRGEPVKHAWYPGRRMNLGIVLLPLRIFLGFVCIYAGMGKLCDRVYFDGGKRGSMVTWLSSLHPWALAEPLRAAALDHPVGAGLSIAFLQVVVGVLTVVGLWQRVAAVFGAALSVALLVTVSWRTVPVYDAPDFIYLAAWSPLIIAGAPVYSVDGHLASDAWRKLGPRADLWDLRRRVLRRGTVLATFVIGSTLLVGSVLGAAVRASSTHFDRPGPDVTPTNNLPGSPLPEVSGGDCAGCGPTGRPHASAPSTAARRPHRKPPATHAPTTAPSRRTTGSTGGPSTTDSSRTPGGSQAPTATTPTRAPAPPPPSPKPSSGGTIGGLLGGPAPSSLLLGLTPTAQPASPIA